MCIKRISLFFTIKLRIQQNVQSYLFSFIIIIVTPKKTSFKFLLLNIIFNLNVLNMFHIANNFRIDNIITQ